jgi:hypothetical protein
MIIILYHTHIYIIYSPTSRVDEEGEDADVQHA